MVLLYLGVVQGLVTGMRGLCNGLGPAMFGVIFYLFHVDLNDEHNKISHNLDTTVVRNETINSMDKYTQLAPGPPFVFGAFMVVIAILVAVFIPEEPTEPIIRRPSSGERKKSIVFFVLSLYFNFFFLYYYFHIIYL